MLPRSSADCWVKPPEIVALPPLIALLTDGAETTAPSSTIPNWFCGGALAASLPVTSANFLPPFEVKSIWTIQPWPCWLSKTALASLTSVPSTPTGPSTYFCVPSSLHATIGSDGLEFAAFSPAVARLCLLAQSSAFSCFWRAGGMSAPGVGGTAGVVGLAGAEGVGLADGAFFSASVTARPCVVGLASGDCEDEAFCSVPGLSLAGSPAALSPGALPFAPPLEGLGLGSGVLVPAVVVSTGRNPSLAVVPTCWRACFASVPLGMFTMMWSVPCVWTSASDTPRPLTRRSMMPAAVFMLVSLIALGLPGWFWAASVKLVPPARSMPSRGVIVPE